MRMTYRRIRLWPVRESWSNSLPSPFGRRVTNRMLAITQKAQRLAEDVARSPGVGGKSTPALLYVTQGQQKNSAGQPIICERNDPGLESQRLNTTRLFGRTATGCRSPLPEVWTSSLAEAGSVGRGEGFDAGPEPDVLRCFRFAQGVDGLLISVAGLLSTAHLLGEFTQGLQRLGLAGR
jgi:hypothetical protein